MPKMFSFLFFLFLFFLFRFYFYFSIIIIMIILVRLMVIVEKNDKQSPLTLQINHCRFLSISLAILLPSSKHNRTHINKHHKRNIATIFNVIFYDVFIYFGAFHYSCLLDLLDCRLMIIFFVLFLSRKYKRDLSLDNSANSYYLY